MTPLHWAAVAVIAGMAAPISLQLGRQCLYSAQCQAGVVGILEGAAGGAPRMAGPGAGGIPTGRIAGALGSAVDNVRGVAAITDVTRRSAGELNAAVKLTPREALTNLLDSGYRLIKTDQGKNGPVTVLTNGEINATIYTGTSTGGPRVQLFDTVTRASVKIKLEQP